MEYFDFIMGINWYYKAIFCTFYIEGFLVVNIGNIIMTTMGTLAVGLHESVRSLIHEKNYNKYLFCSKCSYRTKALVVNGFFATWVIISCINFIWGEVRVTHWLGFT